MKKAQRLIISILSLILILALTSCNSKSPFVGSPGDGYAGGEFGIENNDRAPGTEKPTNEYGEPPSYGTNGDGYKDDMYTESNIAPDGDVDLSEDTDPQIIENPFIKVEEMDTSTFSADVDTASYTFLRKMINEGYSLQNLQNIARYNLIRTEEMVNYFDYSYASAPEGETFGTKATISRTPWNEDTYLLTLGLKAKEIEEKSANNIVFLIDISGSMASADKLPLLRQSFSYLVNQLDENDTVSIVTYAANESVVLEATNGNQKDAILNAIYTLKAGGSTNGEAGIQKAYELAEASFKPDGNNRIIIASDGDLNVGISDPEELEKLVEEKRNSGIFLSVLGFGTGNFRDDNMSAIAQAGNGVYYYIDCVEEAKRIFTDSLLSTIYTVAKDVKFQLTFDKNFVSEYRLIGYENRLLKAEDFENDTKDAGEVGSGHTLTVCYELKLSENADTSDDVVSDKDTDESYWMKLSIRYKEPDSDVSELREAFIGEADFTSEPDDDFKLAASIIEFSMLIRNSVYRNPETTVADIIASLRELTLDSKGTEFLALLHMIK
ncbi:MAG: von Willebrand factor type A domain-containing protein [Clostridia bacterium]|nr:von Willebrand factor type A domain-containing protein [Clostridia bacterium]